MDKKEEKYMRVAIKLKEEDHKKFKIYSTLDNKKMSDILNKCVQDYLKKKGDEHNKIFD
jgi:hypothetical protein